VILSWALANPNCVPNPYNISATTGASDFKFGVQLGFAKAHHKITCRSKDGCNPRLGELPKLWGFPFNIYTVAEVSDTFEKETHITISYEVKHVFFQHREHFYC